MAAELQDAIGKKNVEDRIRFLATRLKNGLQAIPGVKVHTAMSGEMAGGLTTFSVGDVPKANLVKLAMERERIHITNSGLNAGSVRISTHIFTSPSDVDRLLEVVKHVAGNAAKYTSAL
jgi:selenocysteine lyase/cysteine desulfurase